MSGRPDHLDKEEHARILHERVMPESKLASVTSLENPRAIILGGQPGAGKGGLAMAANLEFGGDVISIDPDDLRQFHPDVDRFRRENPYSWSGRTHVDASAWADEALDAASSAKKNLIFDTTLSNGKWASETLIKGLQEKGYQVEVRVISTPKLESELGVDQRFTDSLDANGYGRHVPQGARDAIYQKIPASLDTIHINTNVAIRIFNREGEELYNSRTDPRLPGQALEESRNARLRDPAVSQYLRAHWAQQVEWHRGLPEHAKSIPGIDAATQGRLLHEQASTNSIDFAAIRAEGSATIDELVRPGALPARVPLPEPEIPGLRRAGAAAGIAGLGIAASAYDAHETGQRVSTLLQQQNPVAAQSELNHFAARGIGGWAGGAMAAGVAGSSGAVPLALIAADAYLFSQAFEKGADLIDSRAVYHQRDKQGWEWQYDGRNWTREVALDRTQDGVDQPIKQEVSANYEKARELGAYANRVAVGQALGKLPAPQDPFNIPARPSDQRGLDNQNWARDPHNDQWVRLVKTGVQGANDRGIYTAEVATPERALELNQEARDRIDGNILTGREAVAAAYLQTYAALRHHDFIQDIPDAVAYAKAVPDVVLGSDNQPYRRNEAGEWAHNGNVAQGNRALELELTREIRQPWLERSNAALAELQARPAPTPAEVDRSELLHRYQTYGVRLPEEWLPAVELAVQRTRVAHGITGHSLQQLQPGEMGMFSAESAIVHYQAGPDGAAHKAAITSAEELRQAYRDVHAQRVGHAPIPDAPELRIEALSPREHEAHQQALREANRQGASMQQAAQAAALAAQQVGGGRVNAVHASPPEPEASAARPVPTDTVAATTQAEAAVLAASHAAAMHNAPNESAPPRDVAPQPVQEAAAAEAQQQRLQQEQEPDAQREGESRRDDTTLQRNEAARTLGPAVSTSGPQAQAPTSGAQSAAGYALHEAPDAAAWQERTQNQAQGGRPQLREGHVAVHAPEWEVRAAEVDHHGMPAGPSGPLTTASVESSSAPLAAQAAAEQSAAGTQSERRPEQLPPLQETVPAAKLTPLQPEHPDHALYQQIRKQVTALDAAHGRTFDESSERLTGSLLVLAKDNGLERVDHVVLSRGTADQPAAQNVFVVQGELNNPGHLRASMPTEQAVKTPFEESLQQFDVVDQEQQARAKQVVQQQDAEDQRVQQEMQVAAASMGY